MTLPLTNTTCDIYHTGNGPPNPPDVAGVACFFKPINRHAINYGTSPSSLPFATHLLLVPATTDIRDGFTSTSPTQGLGAGSYDTVYIPNKNSNVSYKVAEVKRVGLGTPLDHKRVYLIRGQVTYPTNDL
jgi:hypothetical protein